MKSDLIKTRKELADAVAYGRVAVEEAKAARKACDSLTSKVNGGGGGGKKKGKGNKSEGEAKTEDNG
jgi:hypothetical protein